MLRAPEQPRIAVADSRIASAAPPKHAKAGRHLEGTCIFSGFRPERRAKPLPEHERLSDYAVRRPLPDTQMGNAD